MRSDNIKKGIAHTPHRALLMATGVSKQNMDAPFIGIASSFTDLVPGHIGMRDLERQIEKGIHTGGGQAFIFGVPAVCDGISMGHSGMRYSLPSRDLIADCVETMAEAHQLDGLVLLSNCDKITPGMLIAAMRLNIPTIIVTAGPMLDGESRCEKLSMIKASFEGIGKPEPLKENLTGYWSRRIDDTNRIVYTIVDVVEKRCKLKQALVKDKKNPNLCLLAAAQTRDKTAVKEEELKDICEQLKKDFDFILVDCPAGIEQGFQNAVAGASEAIVVTTPEMSAVRDADRIIGLLEAKEEIKSYKLLLNRVRPNLIKSNDMMSVEDVVEILSADLVGIIPEDTGIITSTNKGEPIVNEENSLAGKAYRNVARRIMGEEVPFLDLEEETSFMHKVKKFFSHLVGKEK